MSNVDLPLQLHFALFNQSDGFVLKPPEMLRGPEGANKDEDSVRMPRVEVGPEQSWPPHREQLHCTTIAILSLHNCPKPLERRPRLVGRRAECHRYLCDLLSGTEVEPDGLEPCSPHVTVCLYPIGGSCAVSTELPLQRKRLATSHQTWPVKANGLNAPFGDKVHCLAGTPPSQSRNSHSRNCAVS